MKLVHSFKKQLSTTLKQNSYFMVKGTKSFKMMFESLKLKNFEYYLIKVSKEPFRT